MKPFAARLNDARAQARMTQRQLARAVGASPAAISQYLSGQNTPGPERMQALADATGVTVAFLMGQEDAQGAATRGGVKLSDVKITFVKACRCLRKSEDSVRKEMAEGCVYGKAVPGTGSRLNYIFYPGIFREVVGPERFDTFFGVTI